MLELELIRKEDKAVVDKVEKFFEPLHRGHSEFQIRNFILNDDEFPLPDDKYHQAMMEAYGRYEGLIGEQYRWTKLHNEIALEEYEMSEISESGMLEPKKKEVLLQIKSDEVKFKRLQISIIERAAKDTCREIAVFLKCMDEQTSKMKYKTYEEKELEHWLRVHLNQRAKGKTACNIPKRIMQDEKSKKILEDQTRLITGGEKQ